MFCQFLKSCIHRLEVYFLCSDTTDPKAEPHLAVFLSCCLPAVPGLPRPKISRTILDARDVLEGKIDMSHVHKHLLDAAVCNVFKRFCVCRAKAFTVRDDENLRAGYHVVVLFLHRVTQAGTLTKFIPSLGLSVFICKSMGSTYAKPLEDFANRRIQKMFLQDNGTNHIKSSA